VGIYNSCLTIVCTCGRTLYSFFVLIARDTKFVFSLCLGTKFSTKIAHVSETFLMYDSINLAFNWIPNFNLLNSENWLEIIQLLAHYYWRVKCRSHARKIIHCMSRHKNRSLCEWRSLAPHILYVPSVRITRMVHFSLHNSKFNAQIGKKNY